MIEWSVVHVNTEMVKVKQSPYRPRGLQGFEAPIFQDIRHMKVVRLSEPYTLAAFIPQEIFLVLICVRG